MDNLSYSMVVGVYQSPEIARRARDELIQDGYSPDQIHVRSNSANDMGTPAVDEKTYGLYGNVKGDLNHFFHGMTDGESRQQMINEYAKVLESGKTIISVDADNDVEANKAASLMSKNATVASDHTATSPRESDISDTGSWSGVKIFKGTRNSPELKKKVNNRDEGNWVSETGEKMSHEMDEAKIKAKDAMATVATQSKDMLDKASDAVEDIGDKSKQAFDKAADSTRDAAYKLADKTENTLDKASAKIDEWKKS